MRAPPADVVLLGRARVPVGRDVAARVLTEHYRDVPGDVVGDTLVAIDSLYSSGLLPWLVLGEVDGDGYSAAQLTSARFAGAA